MGFLWYPELILAAVCFLFLHPRVGREKIPTNWPFIGMLPAILLNINRLHDKVTELLSLTESNFVFRGPWFTNMTDMLLTSDPANIRHIFNTNFSNYPKGPEFKEFFDVLGDGIFNADSDSWQVQRRVAHHIINRGRFQSFLWQSTCNKLENALIPVFEHVLEQNLVVDLQDIFKRFTFDTTIILLSGTDPGSLSSEFKRSPFLKALDDAEEAIFYRHIVPVTLWKLQRWLGIGTERTLLLAKMHLDELIMQCISRTRQEQHKMCVETRNDFLASYMEEEVDVVGSKSDACLRDTLINLMVAGRSTLSVALTWFFYLISSNPMVERKIVEEIISKGVSTEKEGKKLMLEIHDLNELIYLHGALCEALRLFPSVPFEHKKPLHPDILPSGHKVDSRTKILPLFFSMGRMESIWGKDCLEFKPERWISERGGIKYVPSYKFVSFNSGPRTCLGKGIAFTQMKLVAATLLYNYHVEVVENQTITPKNSIILYMKHGMKVRIKRRF